MYPLIGLNLLRLLSQNKLSEFHTTLEGIDLNQLQTNPFIKQAVDLGINVHTNQGKAFYLCISIEQFLMEGSYNKVWSAKSIVKGEEFMLFYDILMNTTR